MNARTSWSANTDRKSENETDDALGNDAGLPLDDLLEARFDEEGRLGQVGLGSRERTAERFEPRPPTMSADELERAVQKLSHGLEAIENQSRRQQVSGPPVSPDAPPAAEGRESRGRDFVAHSLDRLEARLAALSRRLQTPSGAADAAVAKKTESEVEPSPRQPRAPWLHKDQPSPDGDPAGWRSDSMLAGEGDDVKAAPTASVPLSGASGGGAESAADDAAESSATGGEDAPSPTGASAEAASGGEFLAPRHVAMLVAAEAKQQFAALQSRIETLQASLDGSQIEPVRREMLDLLRQLQETGRDGRAVADALRDVRAKLDDMEVKLNASRNMTGNRLSELQDRLTGLTHRLSDMEAEIPGFDAVRENQAAILERFDLMEGLVHRLVSPEELLDRVEAVRRQLQSIASQQDVAGIEDSLRSLAGRLDSLPKEISDRPALERIERQLDALAVEASDSRKGHDSSAADVDHRLAELASGIKALGEVEVVPDLSGLEARLSDIFVRLDEDRSHSGDAVGGLATRLTALATAVEKQEEVVAAAIVAGLSSRLDTLAEAIESQDAHGARRDLAGLDGKLDLLSRALSEQAGHLSTLQISPLEERLDAMQRQLEEFARHATESDAQFGPFAEQLRVIADRVGGAADGQSALFARLEAIEERLVGLAAKGFDPRSVHTQLEGIISRLELLKGRSIDPARLAELFERVDVAMRAGLTDERFDRIEQKLDTGARSLLGDERVQRLERRLEELGRAPVEAGQFLSQDDLADLRADIIALRRELRSLPGLGEGESSLSGVLQVISERLERLPDAPPATAADLEGQIERIAALLDDPSHGRLALAHIESSLKTIEARLDDARRHSSGGLGDETAYSRDDIGAVAGLARSLSNDVAVLRNTTDISERRTKDALEAVQGTLEAVVKRMAFLERESEPPQAAAGEAHTGAESRLELPAAAVALETERLIEHVPEPSLTEAGPAREGSAGSLFSRFTSSQLLKRATGGRAESFSPENEDGEEASDQPLEPGTDTPLNSALAGAPSSNTALMSGARPRIRSTPAIGSTGGEAGSATAAVELEASGDAFLAAARRAAQAAAAEAAEAERNAERGRGGLSRAVRRAMSRRVVLASALAVAVAFAAFQLLRDRIAPAGIEVADLSGSAAKKNAGSSATEPTAAPAMQAVSATGTQAAPVAPAARPLRPEPLAQQEATSQAPASEPTGEPGGSLQPLGPPPYAKVAAVSPALPSGAATARPVPSRAVEPPLPEDGVTAGVLSGDDAILPAPPAPGASRSVQTASLPPPGPAADAAAVAMDKPPASADEPASATPAVAAAPATALPAGFPAAIGPERLQSAARAGDSVAAFEVAARLAEGRGAAQDLPAAVAWYRRAAEAGLAPAEYRLGSIFEKGLGVPKDLPAAMDWYSRAAEAGNVKAMHNLAVLQAEGAGGTPDLERAAVLFRQAAEHGVRDSQFNLAILHARGLGVPQDMVEAYKWFAVAASSGDPESLNRRDIIAAALSPEDLEKAQAAAAAFQPKSLDSEANDVTTPEGGWGEDASTLQVEAEDDLVALVQRLLAEKGYDPGPADGLLGEQTIQAITSFQKEAGLPTTGGIDTGLVAALQNGAT